MFYFCAQHNSPWPVVDSNDERVAPWVGDWAEKSAVPTAASKAGKMVGASVVRLAGV